MLEIVLSKLSKLYSKTESFPPQVKIALMCLSPTAAGSAALKGLELITKDTSFGEVGTYFVIGGLLSTAWAITAYEAIIRYRARNGAENA